MPVSKKRKKKRTKSYGPPPSKAELASKKKKFSRQQILIIVFSALIIISLAASFIISGLGGSGSQPQPGDTSGSQETLFTPQPDQAPAEEAGSGTESEADSGN